MRVTTNKILNKYYIIFEADKIHALVVKLYNFNRNGLRQFQNSLRWDDTENSIDYEVEIARLLWDACINSGFSEMDYDLYKFYKSATDIAPL